MIESNQRKLLKAKQVAKAIDTETARVYQLTREGEFDDFVVKIGVRQLRYRPDGLAEYIARGGRREQNAAEMVAA